MSIIKRETDYALRALSKLARTDGFLPVSALSDGQHVPELFLRKIMQRLHAAGIVESRQGPFGGYRLALRPEKVTFLDALESVQGPLAMNECFADPAVCGRRSTCAVRARLSELQEELNARLAEITIADVVRGLPSKRRAAR